MRKFLSIMSVLAIMVIAGTTSVKAENYIINDEVVNAAFDAAVAAPISVDFINSSNPNLPTEQAKVSSANPWAAVAIAFFIGGLGIHRFYLGTAVLTGVGYILTCGGIFGLVPFVDFVVLLIGAIDKDISKYEDNTKFFMW